MTKSKPLNTSDGRRRGLTPPRPPSPRIWPSARRVRRGAQWKPSSLPTRYVDCWRLSHHPRRDHRCRSQPRLRPRRSATDPTDLPRHRGPNGKRARHRRHDVRMPAGRRHGDGTVPSIQGVPGPWHVTSFPSPMTHRTEVAVAVAVTDNPVTDAVAERLPHEESSSHSHVGTNTSCAAGGDGLNRIIGEGNCNRRTASCTSRPCPGATSSTVMRVRKLRSSVHCHTNPRTTPPADRPGTRHSSPPTQACSNTHRERSSRTSERSRARLPGRRRGTAHGRTRRPGQSRPPRSRQRRTRARSASQRS